MTKKKMGGLGKLSQFSRIKSQTDEAIPPVQEDSPPIQNPLPPSPPFKGGKGGMPSQEGKKGGQSKIHNGEKLVTINIKITKAQKDWLADTASLVRDNNSEPVPPSERVYPQHLIGVAIEFLRGAQVDWQQVRNVQDLQKQLNL